MKYNNYNSSNSKKNLQKFVKNVKKNCNDIFFNKFEISFDPYRLRSLLSLELDPERRMLDPFTFQNVSYPDPEPYLYAGYKI